MGEGAGGLMRGWISVIACYSLALGAAMVAGDAVGDQHPWLVIGAADVAATVVVFAFSVAFRNASFYDPYWSVIPVVIAGWLLAMPSAVEADACRQWVVMGLVSFWGARLTWNWLRGWTGLDHEDWRYVDLRAKTGRAYPLVNFFGIHLFPTAIVLVGCLPLLPCLAESDVPFGLLDWVAAVVTFGAVLIEATADYQLRRFLRQRTDPSAYLAAGLWRYSRHPNYFGELSFWWGLGLFGLAASPGDWWLLSGAVAMTGLFVFISIPMIEERALRKRPHYAEQVARTSALVPWPPKRG